MRLLVSFFIPGVYVYMNDLHQAVLWYAHFYQGDWTKIAYAIKKQQDYKTIKYPYSFVTYFDKEYPDKLKRLRYPP